MTVDPRAIGDYWGISVCWTFARLHDGVTRQAANSELRGWTPRVHAMFPWRMPDSWGTDITLQPLREELVAGVRERSLLLLGAVGLVLLIAIVNVANLMICRQEFPMPLSFPISGRRTNGRAEAWADAHVRGPTPDSSTGERDVGVPRGPGGSALPFAPDTKLCGIGLQPAPRRPSRGRDRRYAKLLKKAGL